MTSNDVSVDLRRAVEKLLPLAKRLVGGSEESRHSFRGIGGILVFNTSTLINCLVAETPKNNTVDRLRAEIHKERSLRFQTLPSRPTSSSQFLSMLGPAIPLDLASNRSRSLPALTARATLGLFHPAVIVADSASDIRALVVNREREALRAIAPLMNALCSETARKAYLRLPLELPQAVTFRPD